MRVLITGGAGFIGSHLAESYLEKGDDVYIIDDLSTGTLGNIKSIECHQRAKEHLFVTIDTILNRDAMMELVGTCDIVVHMAAAVGVQYILDNPLSSIVTNIRGTEVVLELCDKFKKKVLLASTSEVYGKHDDAPLYEHADCVYGPSSKSRWSYAAAKLMDEFTGLAYHRNKKLPVIIVRLFNTVGPRQMGRYGMVVPRFVMAALRDDPITVYGDGQQTRTFTHVDEVVRCLIKLLETPEAVGDVINIGGVEEVSILQLAKVILEKTESRSEIKMISYEEAYPKDFEDMRRRVPSTEKLHGMIDDAPTWSLDRILDDIIESFKHETDQEFV